MRTHSNQKRTYVCGHCGRIVSRDAIRLRGGDRFCPADPCLVVALARIGRARKRFELNPCPWTPGSVA